MKDAFKNNARYETIRAYALLSEEQQDVLVASIGMPDYPKTPEDFDKAIDALVVAISKSIKRDVPDEV